MLTHHLWNMKRNLGKGIPREKKRKSVQINNLKWHSWWHSASPFLLTVSCSQDQTDRIPLYFNELTWTRGALRSRCPSMQHRAWWAEHAVCDLQLMDVSSHGSNVHQIQSVTYTQPGCWLLQFSEIQSDFDTGENIQIKPLALFTYNLSDSCCVLIRWRL